VNDEEAATKTLVYGRSASLDEVRDVRLRLEPVAVVALAWRSPGSITRTRITASGVSLDIVKVFYGHMMTVHLDSPEEQPADDGGALPVQAAGDMRVGVSGDLDGGVPQALAQHDEGDAGFEGGDDVSVAEIMETYLRHAEGFGLPDEPCVDGVDADGEDRPCGWPWGDCEVLAQERKKGL
jgi:hypothetical protein